LWSNLRDTPLSTGSIPFSPSLYRLLNPHRSRHRPAYRIIMAEKHDEPPSPLQTSQNRCVRGLTSFGCQRLNERSFKDVAGTSFQATEMCDAFWTIYERETTRYDEAFVGRHDRELNVVIVAVRSLPFAPTTHLTRLLARRFCIPSSVRSLPCRTLGPNPIRRANLQPCSLSTWAIPV